jgi:RNA polymerase sigma-70 factor (ECF subfamily)
MHDLTGEPSDCGLAARIAARDERAFELLLARYEEPIRRHVAHIARTDAHHPPQAAAQDLAQEVFLRVWMRIDQWDGRGAFKAWLYRIATNLALNHLRSVRRRREQPLVIEDSWDEEDAEDRIPSWVIDDAALGTHTVPGPHDALERTERLHEVQQLVDELPEAKREVLHLVHELEMSIRDAAAELGIPEGTAKSRLHYAKRRLARQWQDLQATREGP